MSKPTNKPGWNPSDPSKVVEPNSTKKSQGWAAGEKPAAEHFNWLMKTVSQWIDYIDVEGVQGPKGDVGPAGAVGPKGDAGPAGLQGEKGDVGPSGAIGPKGDTGPSGLQGEKGDTGPAGAVGPKGDTGPSGLQGEKGDVGPSGAIGSKGDTGPAGLQGEKGDTGPAGAVGPKGDTGSAGAVGPKGDTGPAGPAGADGSISAANLARIAALEAAVDVPGSSPVTVTFPYNGGAAPGEYSIGNSGSSVSVNWSNGVSQFVTLSDNATFSFSNAVAGNTYYLRIQQGGYGNKQAYLPSNIVWNSGSVPVISVSSWTIDVIGLYFDGTYYYGYVSQGYSSSPAIDTKSGYIAGGFVLNGTTATAVGNVDKINFNSDQTISTVQTTFGQTLSSTGSSIYPTALGASGQGTQSSTHGYRITAVYATLPAVASRSSTDAAHKLAFANDTEALAVIRVVTNLSAANVSHNNKAVVQSSSNAYFLTSAASAGTTYQTAKLQFSTDVTSNVVATGPNVGGTVYFRATHAISSLTSGIFWGTGATQSTAGLKVSFATDTAFSSATYILPAAATSEGFSEAVDGEYKGYYIRGTGSFAVPTTTAYVTDKSVEGWSTLSTVLSQAGVGSAATQGLNAGYFCGRTNWHGQGAGASIPSNNATVVSSSQVKKIEFNTDNFTVHSASLNQARVVACGFEG